MTGKNPLRKKTRKKILRLIILLSVLLALTVAGVLLIWQGDVKSRYPLTYSEYVTGYAEEFELDPYLVYAVIRTESGFRPEAVSGSGAIGLMQLMPATAEEMAQKLNLEDYGVDRLTDPEINIRLGCRYLQYLQGCFKDTGCVIAAYNAGPNAVRRWLADPEYSADGKTLTDIPYRETRDYVRKVKQAYEMYQKIYSPRP